MKTKMISSIILLLSVYLSTNAQHTAITTSNKEIAHKLDLKAVAYLFGTSNNLAHFEKQINSPQNAISDLDLNRDGYVDYLRVIESNRPNAHTVNIQAVLGNDLYKDIAMIDVQKDRYGKTQVRMIGNQQLYGYNQVLQPIYANKPVIVANFWRPNYKAYRASYHTPHPVHYKARIISKVPAHNAHHNYHTRTYYSTNRTTATKHYSTKPQDHRHKHELQYKTKDRKQTTKPHQEKQLTARDQTSRTAATNNRHYTSSVREVSNNRATTTRTTQKNTRSELALR